MTDASAPAPSQPPISVLPSAPVTRGCRLEIVSLGKAYIHNGTPLPILWNVDLHLEPGDMVAVVGASGVGKSTFLQLIGTLDLPTSGSIKFNGEELTRMGATRLSEFRNKHIGFVFQFHHLLPDFTALENCAMPGLIARLDSTTARQRAAALLDRVGLSKRLDHRPGELSGGEQQRVALARALLLEPRMLLADEPTGNLDSQTGDEIHELMVELNRERGMTMLVVTHNKQMASRLPLELRMADGRLVERASQAAAS